MSNFLLWQIAYTEFVSVGTQWPDFDGDQLDRALSTFARRQRRYGGLVDVSDKGPALAS